MSPNRKDRTKEKHARIRLEFAKRYTHQKRVNGVRRFTQEYIIALLADEFYLSMRSVEKIIYCKSEAAADAGASQKAAA